jgi:hypothetical protein
LGALFLQHVDLRKGAVEQRLLLRDIQAGGRAQIVPRGRQSE